MKTPIALALCLALSGTMGLAHADDGHERARKALAAGEILPLPTVLERVAKQQPGTVVEVELDRRDQLWVYEFKILSPAGGLIKLWVDARDANIIERREKGR